MSVIALEKEEGFELLCFLGMADANSNPELVALNGSIYSTIEELKLAVSSASSEFFSKNLTVRPKDHFKKALRFETYDWF